MWFISLFYIMIKGGLINNHFMFGFFNVDLVIIFIVYLFIFHGETSAGIFAFSQGLLIDVFSGGILGLFTLVYVIFFIGVKFGSYPFHLHSSGGQIIFISLASLLKEFLVLLFMNLFSFETSFSFTVFTALFASSIFTGLLAPIIFFILRKINSLVAIPAEEA